MDYRRNGAPFYTQGINIQKGCYCCKCSCCDCCKCCCCDCCPPSILFLRENIDPESRDFNVGVKKGTTEVQNTCCCSCCRDKTASSTSQEGFTTITSFLYIYSLSIKWSPISSIIHLEYYTITTVISKKTTYKTAKKEIDMAIFTTFATFKMMTTSK